MRRALPLLLSCALETGRAAPALLKEASRLNTDDPFGAVRKQETFACSSSRFGAGGTAEAGSDSGCGGMPLSTLADALKGVTADVPGYGTVPFFGIAPAQSMYQVKMDFSVARDSSGYENCGEEQYTEPCNCCPSMRNSAAASSFDGVLHVGCGDCVVFTASRP